MMIKLNYRCPKGTVSPDSYECPESGIVVDKSTVKRLDGSELKLTEIPNYPDYFDLPAAFRVAKPSWIAKVKYDTSAGKFTRENLPVTKIGRYTAYKKADLNEKHVYELGRKTTNGYEMIYFEIKDGKMQEVPKGELKNRVLGRMNQEVQQTPKNEKDDQETTSAKKDKEVTQSSDIMKQLRDMAEDAPDLEFNLAIIAIEREMRKRGLL